MKDENNGFLYEVALSRVDGIGSVLYKQITNYLGSAEVFFKTPNQKLLKIPGIGNQIFKNIKSKDNYLFEAEKIIKDAEKEKVRIVHLKSPDYPVALKRVFDSPPVIYVKGQGSFFPSRTISIVGTRRATSYGLRIIEDLVKSLKEVQIISGMAYGIDIAAHKEALKNGLSTIGVLANGLETVYPQQHSKIAHELFENGLLVSEHPVGTKLQPQYFVTRNRIIAALSEITLIVESEKRGGSMITAEYANNYNKDVFAIPGDIYNRYSTGTNYLIFKNKAQIYTDAAALIDWMNWDDVKPVSPIQISLDFENYSEIEQKVLSLLLDYGELLIDDLSWHANIPPNQLSSILLNLEFQDAIKQVPGKKFSLKKR